jgi:hypothetical protein
MVWSDHPMWGVILGTVYCVSVPVFILWRGYTISNLALMTMMSIHAGGIIRVESSATFAKRCLWSLGVFFVLASLLYTPLINQMERRWFVALSVGKRVLYVQTGLKPDGVRRGEWIAYQLDDLGMHRYAGNIVVNGGCTLGRVLGVGGDELKFTPKKVLVAGQEFAAQAYMPTTGTVNVEAGNWFIWPGMSVFNHGVGDGAVADTMMRLAKVPETSYLGTPYQRWLWRTQTLP